MPPPAIDPTSVGQLPLPGSILGFPLSSPASSMQPSTSLVVESRSTPYGYALGRVSFGTPRDPDNWLAIIDPVHEGESFLELLLDALSPGWETHANFIPVPLVDLESGAACYACRIPIPERVITLFHRVPLGFPLPTVDMQSVAQAMTATLRAYLD